MVRWRRISTTPTGVPASTFFEGVFGDDEVADLVADFDRFLERAPISSIATTDAAGRPALSPGPGKRKRFTFGKPLGDPFGGTAAARGRYQARMTEYDAPDDAPEEVLVNVTGALQFMDSFLRLYGHPLLLALAEHINGPDFVPFREALVDQGGGPRSVHRLAPGRHHALEQPGTGRRYARLQLHGPALSHHRRERAVARSRLALRRQDRHQGAGGCQRRLRPPAGRRADGVPARRRSTGQPPDPARRFRQPFPTAAACRSRSASTARASIAGVVGEQPEAYDDERIHRRARVIALGIDARRQRFPDEPPFAYRPLAAEAAANRWTEANREAVLTDYEQYDLGI